MKTVSKKEDLDKVVSYSIVEYAKNYDCDREKVAQHIAYCFYRKPHELEPEFINQLEDLGNDDADFAFHSDDYCGFNDLDGKFNPEPEIEVLKQLFADDPDTLKKCSTLYLVWQIGEKLEIKPKPAKLIIDDYKQLKKFVDDQESMYGKDAWVSIRKDFLFDAENGKIGLQLFRLMVAVKSLIGNRNFTRTYKDPIHYRMYGCKNDVSRKDLTNQHKAEINSISIRYRFDKLKTEAQERKLLTFLPSVDRRGFYVMFGYDPEKLTKLVMERLPKKEIQQRNKKASQQLQDYYKQLKAKDINNDNSTFIREN